MLQIHYISCGCAGQGLRSNVLVVCTVFLYRSPFKTAFKSISLDKTQLESGDLNSLQGISVCSGWSVLPLYLISFLFYYHRNNIRQTK